MTLTTNVCDTTMTTNVENVTTTTTTTKTTTTTHDEVTEDVKKKDKLRCANCGGLGHVYKKCSEPITSYGVICTRKIRDEVEYLMVRRKDSLSYVEFLRGKYSLHDLSYIKKLIFHMTFEEQTRILKNSFPKLWKWLWQIDDCTSFRKEYENASLKFEHLKNDRNLEKIVLEAICNGVGFQETEWGFAKGRRNIGEADIDCAMREFYEETGMSRSIRLDISANTVEETFLGSNDMLYRHVYYIARVVEPSETASMKKIQYRVQSREVGAVAWFTYVDTQNRIRDYNMERKMLLEELNKKL